MSKAYRLNWLRAGDARQVARLEAKVYPRSYRSGRRALREQLRYAEAAGENLSVGLFLGDRLVGYCLLFVEEHRQKICTYLDISPPPGLELDGPGLYLADLAVHPAHRSRSWALVSRLACVLESRDDLRSLPMEALSTPDMLRFWKSRRRVLAGLGFVLERSVEFQEDDVPFPLHWLQFAQRRTKHAGSKRQGNSSGLDDAVTVQSGRDVFRIGVVRTEQGWSSLSEDWDTLYTETPGATVFCSFSYLRAWWRQLGLNSELRLVVVQHAASGDIQAIAPMQVLLNPSASPHRRCLSFIGQPSEVDRPTLLTRGEDPLCARLIADYLMRSYGNDWDSMILYEQYPESPFLPLMRERLGKAGLLVDAPAGPDCPRVDVSGSWEGYLASLGRSQRKSLKRHIAKVKAAGTMQLDTVDQPVRQNEGLRRYLEVEGRSWKARGSVSVARSSAHLGFLRALMSEQPHQGGEQPRLHFRFLQVDGEDIAATIGLYWKSCLYALHVAHDGAFDALSPGFVLTALELEEAFRRDDYSAVDYLGGFMSNKRGWATECRATRALFAQPRNLIGYRYHLYHFRCKPWVKRQLAKRQLLEPLLRWKKALGRRERGLA